MEVPTEEELTGYKTLETTVQTLTKEKDDLAAANKAYAEDPTNKNWQLVRTANDNMRAALKAQGKEVKEDGSVVESQKQMTVEEVRAEATKAASEAFVNNYKSAQLKKLPEDQRKVVEHFFTKLSAGEVLDVEKVDNYLNQATTLAQPPAKSGGTHVNGHPPQFKTEADGKPKFGDTPEGQDIANDMFKGESFAKPPAK